MRTPRGQTAVAFAAAIVLPFIGHNGAFTNFLADAGAFVLLALGLNIVVGFAGLLDLGYAAFFAIGSYSFAMLGGFLIGLIEAMTTQFISDQWANVVVFSVLVLVLIFRPSGLLGESLPNKV